MIYNNEILKEDQKKALDKTRPVIDNTKKQAFVSISKSVGKQAGLGKHAVLKNIERKYGPKEAHKQYKEWVS